MIQIALQSKNRFPRLPLTIFILVAFSMALIACGGSGGSGGGGSNPGASYSGLDTPAVITSENHGTLLEDSYEGAMTNDTMVPFGVSGPATQDGKTPLPSMLQTAFADSLAAALDTSGSTRGAMASATEQISDGQGGTASYSVNYNESTGVFSGSFTYSGFTGGGVTLTGSATFSGRIDPNTSEFDYFAFSFTNMTTTADGQSSTINGTLNCDFLPGGDLLITSNIVVADGASGETCWLRDYTVQTSGTQLEISGTFYEPTYGYVQFQTIEPLIISGSSEYPSAGLIEFTGADGVNGQPTKARLRAHSTTTCQVTADFLGNGTFDYDSGVIPWTDL